MAADADPTALMDIAKTVGSALVGGILMLVGVLKAWANIKHVAEDAKSMAEVNAERLESHGSKIGALEAFRASSEAHHEAIMDNFAQLHRRHDEILRRLGG